MSDNDASGRNVTEVGDQILRDLQSKNADVLCPVHGVPPKFEVDDKGSVVEHFCCEALLKIFRELGANDSAERGA